MSPLNAIIIIIVIMSQGKKKKNPECREDHNGRLACYYAFVVICVAKNRASHALSFFVIFAM